MRTATVGDGTWSVPDGSTTSAEPSSTLYDWNSTSSPVFSRPLTKKSPRPPRSRYALKPLDLRRDKRRLRADHQDHRRVLGHVLAGEFDLVDGESDVREPGAQQPGTATADVNLGRRGLAVSGRPRDLRFLTLAEPDQGRCQRILTAELHRGGSAVRGGGRAGSVREHLAVPDHDPIGRLSLAQLDHDASGAQRRIRHAADQFVSPGGVAMEVHEVDADHRRVRRLEKSEQLLDPIDLLERLGNPAVIEAGEGHRPLQASGAAPRSPVRG